MNAVIYARYSSSNQREESIDAQVRECKKYAKQNGLNILRIYIDKAQSGTNDKREDFQRMIKDSDKKDFNTLLIWKQDRFARNRYDSIFYKHILKQNGIKVVSITEPISDDPTSVITEGILESFAEFYSKSLSENTKRDKKKNALKKQSNGGVTPTGYKKLNGKLIVDEEKARIVRYVFQCYINNVSYAKIIKSVREKFCYKISMSGLKTLLANEVYTGKYIYRTNDGETFTYENNHEAIISAETFLQAQEKRLKNKRSPNAGKGKKKYFLSGLIKCGECGAPIVVSHSYKNGLPAYFRLYCLNRKDNKNCNNPTRKMELAEEAVLNAIKNNILNRKIIKTLAEKACSLQENNTSNKLKELKDELKNIQKAKDNIISAIEMGIFTSSTKSRLEELENTEANLKEQIANEKDVKVKILTAPEIEKFLKKYCSGNMEDESFRYELIQTFCKEVLMFKDRLEIILKLADLEIKETIQFE